MAYPISTTTTIVGRAYQDDKRHDDCGPKALEKSGGMVPEADRTPSRLVLPARAYPMGEVRLYVDVTLSTTTGPDTTERVTCKITS